MGWWAVWTLPPYDIAIYSLCCNTLKTGLVCKNFIVNPLKLKLHCKMAFLKVVSITCSRSIRNQGLIGFRESLSQPGVRHSGRRGPGNRRVMQFHNKIIRCEEYRPLFWHCKMSDLNKVKFLNDRRISHSDTGPGFPACRIPDIKTYNALRKFHLCLPRYIV